MPGASSARDGGSAAGMTSENRLSSSETNAVQFALALQEMVRRFRAKPDKKIVDNQAASPSSWKTPCIAAFIVW